MDWGRSAGGEEGGMNGILCVVFSCEDAELGSWIESGGGAFRAYHMCLYKDHVLPTNRILVDHQTFNPTTPFIETDSRSVAQRGEGQLPP